MIYHWLNYPTSRIDEPGTNRDTLLISNYTHINIVAISTSTRFHISDKSMSQINNADKEIIFIVAFLFYFRLKNLNGQYKRYPYGLEMQITFDKNLLI